MSAAQGALPGFLDFPDPSRSRIAVWFSCGAASAVAAKLTLERFPDADVRIVNNPVAEEDADNRRFLADVAAWLGRPVEEARNSQYPDASCDSVWKRRRILSTRFGAPCTINLKKKARQEWEAVHSPDWHVLGFTAEERRRHDRFVLTERSNVIPVLIDAGMTKDDCASFLRGAGIALPAVYARGYPNANCIGCVKATSPTYWNHVRRMDPEVFAERARQGREYAKNPEKLVRYKGKRITLDELPADAIGAPMKSLRSVECGIFCEENVKALPPCPRVGRRRAMSALDAIDRAPALNERNAPIRFVIFSSYGNDSMALIQWAHEWKLEGVAVVYSDTGWAAADWQERVDEKEAWARSLGFWTYRTTSIGFADLARKKKGSPTQQYQWCSYILKIEPGQRWLAENDPDRRAVCLVGVRQEESQARASFPLFMPKSENHGDRVILAPFAHMDADARDGFLKRAGVEPLPHRSRECKCINSNRLDLRRFTDADVAEIEALEVEVGKPMFRPHRHMGAKGVREVKRWADSPRGQYELPEEIVDCDPGYCEARNDRP